jgi:hypothetical protein
MIFVTKMQEYITHLQSALPCSLETLIQHSSSEVKEYCRINSDRFREIKTGDKGGIGKKIEFYVFGRLPNNDRNPDTDWGDITTTHIKRCRDGYCAKERLTLTNCGNTTKPETLQHLVESELTSNKLYPKLRTGILLVLYEDEIRYILRYDIEEFGMESILEDYEKIQNCVKTNKVSQTGQKCLHIHPHGCKKSKTRALGFTNKFVTRLIAHYCKLEVRVIGNSLVF